MIIETNSPEETFALGQKLGEQAKAGQIYTLDLSEADSVVHYDQESTGMGFLATVQGMIDSALSYFR